MLNVSPRLYLPPVATSGLARACGSSLLTLFTLVSWLPKPIMAASRSLRKTYAPL